MSQPRDDRRVVMRYRPAPGGVVGWATAWLRDAWSGAGQRVSSVAARASGLRVPRGWWVGPTAVVAVGVAAWAALGPASVGSRPTLGPAPAEGRGIDLSTGVPPAVAFGRDDAAEAPADPGPLVIDLQTAAAEEAARESARTGRQAPIVEPAETAEPEPAVAVEGHEVEDEPIAKPTAMIASPAPKAERPAVTEPTETVETATPAPTEVALALAARTGPTAEPEPTAAPRVSPARAVTAKRSIERAQATPADVPPADTPSATQAELVALAKPVPPPPPAGSRTQRVVYMVDLSGSLVDSLPEAVRWIGEALDALDQPAVFTVLFFRRGEVIEAPPYGLKPATFVMKWEAYDWMRPEQGHVEAGGKATLSDAVLAALRYEVDRVVLLSDDGFGRGLTWVGGPTLLDEIAMTLPNGETRIDTVQFFYRDAAGAMEAIADRFGGDYTFIGAALPDDEPAFVDLYGKLRTR
ncbi:MAG: hypothetical protein AAGB29_14755 [Planctomycetota bacterium]